MSKKRRDKRGRILHVGEMQLPDGRYRYKYVDRFGKERCVYSWRLDKNDPNPVDKKKSLSLREKEKKIQVDLFNQLVPNGGNMTVLDLVERYVSTKVGVRPTTEAGYRTVINYLKKDPFGRKRIDTIKLSDAKLWLIRLQTVEKKRYSTIHAIRGVINPAFKMAVEDDLIRKNPFGFELASVVVNDSVTRDAITREQERKFLNFVKEDKHFCRYYEGIYILFKTGLRISEFCGLTISDIDFKNHSIRVERQLRKDSRIGYYIEETKTSSGVRMIPMSAEVELCFRKIIENRRPPRVEPMIGGKAGFLFFDNNGRVCYSLHWEHYFRHIVDKYNSIYKIQMPRITPHVCRHTYCSNMAKAGMNPKTLQYLMGHSDISVTMNTYTHVNFEDAQAEVIRLGDAI